MQNPAKVIVYACMASDCKKMLLIMFERNKKLTGVRYVQSFKTIMTWMIFEYPEARHQQDQSFFKFTFHQDAAACHTSSVARIFLRSEFTNRFLNKATWPPSSLDLNSLDFSIYDELARKAQEMQHSNLQYVKKCIIMMWVENIDEEFNKNLVIHSEVRISLLKAEQHLMLNNLYLYQNCSYKKKIPVFKNALELSILHEPPTLSYD